MDLFYLWVSLAKGYCCGECSLSICLFTTLQPKYVPHTRSYHYLAYSLKVIDPDMNITMNPMDYEQVMQSFTVCPFICPSMMFPLYRFHITYLIFTFRADFVLCHILIVVDYPWAILPLYRPQYCMYFIDIWYSHGACPKHVDN